MHASQEVAVGSSIRPTSSSIPLRAFRLFLAVLAVAAVFAAQYLIIDPGLQQVRWAFLLRLLPQYPDLLAQVLAARQQTIILLTVFGALLFAVATPPLPRAVLPRVVHHLAGRPSPASTALILLGLLSGVGVGIYLVEGNGETVQAQVVWTLAVLAYGLGCLAGSVPRPGATQDSYAQAVRARPGWPAFLLVFLCAGGLLGWQLASVPLHVDGEAASHGLQALAILSGQETGIFRTGWTDLPLLAYYPAALGMLLSGDPLLGTRLAGLAAGLLTLLGVWLVGQELFQPFNSRADEEEADTSDRQDSAHPNRSPAPMLAVILLAIGYAFIHFSRLPRFIEPLPWGVLALWAIHRGVRTGDAGVLGLGGLLLGLATVLYENGLVFAPIAFLWWIGMWIFRRVWLTQSGVGWGGFGMWLGGIVTFLAPFIAAWQKAPVTFPERLHSLSVFTPAAQSHLAQLYGTEGIGDILLENLRRSLGAFQIYFDTSGQFGYQLPLLDALSAPLLVLGLGVLLLNIDRLLSWLLLSWMLVALLLGGVLTVNAPFWPYLLPTLPAAALIAAVAVARWRCAAYWAGGSWLRGLSTSLVIGLVLLTGVVNWVRYYELVTIRGDAPTFVGRALRQLDNDRIPYLLQPSDTPRPGWDDRVVSFLTNGGYRFKERGQIQPPGWPAQLPPGSVILLHPDDQGLAAEAEARYPGGAYWVQRNRTGDPILFLYLLP